ncbi:MULTISPECIES: AraC family transcriptional regulator [unclassified Caballeronia]|uniref:AraC family transcriptional regulator n=1 Tax=unclassified Caballeronia TaxID=2646786 RepID=UPI002865C5FE|nr:MULTISPECIES: AraC family transcriptional regulator [unclassified Caballeronia]MDR5739543.1 AraC family transcriptional regulator [Caballeronia sp. LZ016]MDR5808012.1 AraC family transcriptional regulator [Caballeronia sp. LZ019]
MALNDMPGLAGKDAHDSPPDTRRNGPLDAALDQARVDLVSLLDRFTAGCEGSLETPVPGVFLHRITNPGGPKPGMQTPALALIAQGSKRVMVGDDVYVYDPMHYLVSSVDLPVIGQVTAASETEPYLGMRLDLDVEEITSLIQDQNLPPATQADASRGLYVNRLGTSMLDAVLRLLRLIDTPEDVPIVAPLVKREILYRLLMNGSGARLRQIALQDSQTQRIAKAISLLRRHFDQPLRVEDIAKDVHMSVSSLHHHFKAVTAMSPLQYQKQLRLQEARRLMLLDIADAATAAHRVGYESASQFSREYSRLFGAPPLRDTRRWRDAAAGA